MDRKIVTDDFVGQLLESNGWDKAGIRVDERGSKPQKEAIEVEGAKTLPKKSPYDNPKNLVEANCCPLCESDLGEMELTDEALQEHAVAMMDVFSEAGLISEQVEESFIIENADEILEVLSEAGLIVEATNEETDEE